MNDALPLGTPPFDGTIARLIGDATPRALVPPRAPEGAPNVLLVMLDDVGFGSCGAFGGPVPMPALERVAQRGLRFNQFHTTALCSPTRAAVLTGRNHHTVHMGGITEIANSFPGYDSAIPPEAATVAQVLQLSGYNTGCFGKWHLTPSWEQSPAGPFHRWPTGMGFERFYGIIGAEASQWEPPVYDQTTPIEPYIGRDDYHLSEDLADQAITWIERQQASSPHKPFFCYLSMPAVHAPHHVAPEWWQQFAGQFDDGWDALRERIHQRQLDLGVIPAGTVLTPRPDEIPAWDDYPERYRPVAARLMEVFAGFLAHTDAQVGRVLDAIERLGLDDDTLVIYLTGDNGASAEGTVHGAWSAPSFQNGVHEDPEWLLDHLDDFGTARCENHYNVGWAWALDAPFQWMKQVASHFGGTRNGLAVRWPRHIADEGGLRSQFHHVIDLAPTIYAAVGITPPAQVNGLDQLPLHGTPMNYTFDDPAAPSTRRSQYFEILGNRAMYHDGWIASCFHGRLPWIRLQGLDFDGPQEVWELYDIEHDFSQSVDLAASHPDKLAELQALFHEHALEHGVYPLRDAGAPRNGDYAVPASLAGVTRMTYTTAHVRMPESSVVNLKNGSWRVTAEVEVGDASPTGVIVAQGGSMAGWSMYFDDDGHARYHYNCFGHHHTSVRSVAPVPAGRHTITAEFLYDGGFGAGGALSLRVDDGAAVEGRIEQTVPLVYSMSGETFDVGVDTGSPVGPYPHHFPCTAAIRGVTLERLDKPSEELLRQMRAGEFAAGLRTQ